MVVALGPRARAGAVRRRDETAAVAAGLRGDVVERTGRRTRTRDLVTRRLPTDRTWCSVIDEAAGLCRAITGCPPAALVQRCEPHELRNALGHLAEPLHVVLGKALRGCVEPGFSGPRGESAGARPPGARRRPFGRVLEETLTVEGSVSRDRIERTLHTTNVIGNQMESVEGHTQRVKRWREASLIRRFGWRARWGAEPRFRRMRAVSGPAISGRCAERLGTARRRGC